MPSAIDQLRNKLAERLNWDTFTKEIGQGMETLPTPMTVLTPGTFGKFAKELALNKQWAGYRYGLPENLTDAIAFIKTRYPKTFNRARNIEGARSKLTAGMANELTREILLNVDPQVWKKENPIEVLGHEFGHLVTGARYPELLKDKTINKLYSKALRRAPLRNIPLLKELYWNAVDEIYKHPIEAIPDKYGRAAKTQFNKFLEMSK